MKLLISQYPNDLKMSYLRELHLHGIARKVWYLVHQPEIYGNGISETAKIEYDLANQSRISHQSMGGSFLDKAISTAKENKNPTNASMVYTAQRWED